MPKNNNNNNKGKGKKSFDQPLEKITDDPRFTHVHNDPRFKRPRRKDTKVTIDNRFSSMLKSSEFAEQPKVDRYGRPIAPQTAENELKRFYEIEDESDDEEEEKTLEELERELAEDEENLEDEKIPIVKPRGLKYDPMRGQGIIDSSDEEITDEEESDEEEPEAEIPTGDATYRIAAVNMDWDRIRAIDLLKVLNAFKPTTSVIKQVSIYPSEFGKERMAREEMEGPPKELFEKEGDSSKVSKKNDDEEEHDGDFDQEALRKYQLDRLKYYYAVIECDSVETAQALYKACDGNEYEASANFFDLRYIPDEMTFEQDEPKEVCTYAPEDYKPSTFSTDALQHTKVKLTWDMDDHHRLEVTRRNFTQGDLQDLDFEAYLASSDDDESDDDGEDVDALREKYRKLLENTDDSAFDNHTHGEEGDMEVTFTPGLTEAANEAVNKRLNVTEEKEETTVETYMRKQREKKMAKKERRQAERDAEDEEDEDSEEDEELENDPFFKEAMDEIKEETPKAKKSDKKKGKKGKSKEEREKEEREKAELELLMGDNEKGEGFDMRDVLKREKVERKKGKKNKKKLAELTGAQDDFEINVSDPRFNALHENHQFAIDPTSSQFKKTKSMQKLLSARQEKLKNTIQTDEEWKKEAKKSSKDKSDGSDKKSKKDGSLAQLVASVKRKGGAKQEKIGKRQKS